MVGPNKPQDGCMCVYISASFAGRDLKIYIYKCMYTYSDCIFVDLSMQRCEALKGGSELPAGRGSET